MMVKFLMMLLQKIMVESDLNFYRQSVGNSKASGKQKKITELFSGLASLRVPF
jgi:hypothetical protein